MNRIPFLDLKAQFRQVRSEVSDALEAVCESASFVQGPPTAQFERAFAAYCGVEHCVTVNSGTSALHVALRCLDIGPGDEVITVPFTFVATVWAISYVGATPVFVDVDSVRRTMDPCQIESAITPRTKAIIPVHLYGMPVEMAPVLSVANKYGIPVVEDAAQAHGARYKGRRVGQFGCIACFSFYPGKNLGACGEGGALVTNSERFATRARRLRDHAQGQRYHHDETGYNYRMDSIQGSILNIKLKHLDAWNAARVSHARRYQELLRGLPIRVPESFADSESIWHLFVVEHPERDLLRQRLTEAGIDTGLHYPIPIHLQKAFAGLGYRRGDFPVSERLAESCLSLPMFAELTESQLEAVSQVVRETLR